MTSDSDSEVSCSNERSVSRLWFIHNQGFIRGGGGGGGNIPSQQKLLLKKLSVHSSKKYLDKSCMNLYKKTKPPPTPPIPPIEY